MVFFDTSVQADVPRVHLNDLRSLKLGPHKIYKTAEKTLNLVSITGGENQFVYIQTPVFYSCVGPRKTLNGQRSIPYNSEQGGLDNLRSFIECLEAVLEEKLTDFLLTGDTSKLNRFVRDFYLQEPKLRPCFNTLSTFWVKLATDCAYYTWQREPLAECNRDLGPGQYQLILRCGFVYLGQHGDTGRVASLNIRATQLRYQPMEFDGGARTALKFCMFRDPIDQQKEPEEESIAHGEHQNSSGERAPPVQLDGEAAPSTSSGLARPPLKRVPTLPLADEEEEEEDETSRGISQILKDVIATPLRRQVAFTLATPQKKKRKSRQQQSAFLQSLTVPVDETTQDI